jgi:hypothetical protein
MKRITTLPDPIRRTILAGGAVMLAGCATGPRDPITVIREMVAATRKQPDIYPVSDADILADPNAQLGVRVGELGPGIMRLAGQGTQGDEDYQWLAPGPILMVTQHGRIRATRGFSPELAMLQFHGPDPLIRICAEISSLNARRSTRFAFRDETDRAVFDEQVATLRWVRESQISLLGNTYRCEHWQETVTTLPGRKQHQNHFHVHSASGHVLESIQKPFHDSPVIRTQLLKAPGPGPRT